MATAHGVSTHLQTGPMAASAPITANEVQEYERILRISDEIFAGSHPRLKVPQQFVRKPATRNGQAGLFAQQHVKNKPLAQKASENALLQVGTRSPNTTQGPRSGTALSTASAISTPPSTRLTSKTVSEIDPIFLTKSDDLVRAELQLQRQRLERTLRDKLEQKKESKQKPALSDTRPEFDVSEVFQKALQMVAPVSLSEPSEANGDSFDENSFYSSRAPDSPDGGQQKLSPVAPAQPVGLSTRVPVETYADELQRLETLNRPGSDQEMRDAYPVADQRAPSSQKQPSSAQAEISRRLHESQQLEALEEPEYSPPAPVAPPINPRYYEQGVANGDRRGRNADRNRATQVPTSPADVTIVRQNHITSPAAPRPSRVSPLAVAKVPSVQQVPVQRSRDERLEHASAQVISDPDSGLESPNGQVPLLTSRKRRRLQERGEGARNVSYRRQDVEPSDIYIKEEPISPPPFADDPSMVRSRHSDQQQPVYIDIASPQYTPVLERQELPTRRPVYENDPHYEFPQSRTTSRLGTRRPAREDGDLRRVASLQYARQSDYPREYIEADPHGSRATSYAVMERPQERSRYYEELPSGYGPQYITLDDPQQPVYRDPYYEEAPPPRAMPAPQRRFVVDEHGNQYEMIPTSRPQPMAPPPRPISQMPKDVYDDRGPVRTAGVRAPSVVHDPYVERRYMPEMPPPQPVYRRVASDYARPVAGERRTYAAPMESHDPYTRGGSVQVAEYLPRRQTYVEEQPIPQERVIRTASARPQQSRYEEPHHEIVQRVGSVRPAGPSRDVSVFLDDRQMGEYIERPYYVRERRYFEGEDGNRVAMDGTESVQRVPQRY
ncbi:hypothetical protein N7448_004923 [Penicillium atrosanguineum]|uniref:Uncharacterized protein n=1 Tax=Penicillium atrosanguineum TaxID=1132637 RepID=A0A9W9PRJ2_9EURO|nr:Mitochondrial fission 1 protein [Penicillium atrosanguineum]KAJ5125603.1 hypothetical protein N7526_007780 [Penicillium atrosanguineum]KAJ5136369.1 hypothetical protein N7448_004923 [Penicillium atrosanguineum]KAJ5292718.1 Mitochondrial fission 1 protein [Penicillium atrosanguineum]KAJ5303257.1 hypothetical protein N7476_010056 [Penicillium atrosanguineum]